MYKTEDIRDIFKQKLTNKEFRITKDGTKTLELQAIQFEANNDWIIRKPNYEYAKREIAWYISMSRNVYDMKPPVPKIWQQVADINGDINSNYGWMIYSKENGSQYYNCLWSLMNDPTTRQAVMIYTRPSMQQDWNKNHMHDFCCTHYVHCFLNKKEDSDGYDFIYAVYQRSCDSVFGYNSDVQWHMHVQKQLATDLAKKMEVDIEMKPIIYNCGSLHVYERHFKYLKE
ncbi:MAG: dCMP hydroxymethylase [Clostridia bacterium]|nr:dCMP hydroxymethylase [Clostridia bacterium]